MAARQVAKAKGRPTAAWIYPPINQQTGINEYETAPYHALSWSVSILSTVLASRIRRIEADAKEHQATSSTPLNRQTGHHAVATAGDRMISSHPALPGASVTLRLLRPAINQQHRAGTDLRGYA